MMILRRRVMGSEPSIDYASMYFTIKALTSGTIGFTGEDLYYSLDNGSTWSALAKKTPINLQANDKILFKGTPTPLEDGDEYSGIGSFYGTCSFNVYGNAMSLLFGDNFESQYSLADKDSAFNSLFSDWAETESPASVVNASNLILPATILSESCYFAMFAGCESLIKAPQLPATNLARNCYYAMLSACPSLTIAPELPATTLKQSCYYNMFWGCTNLTKAPELPATTLVNYCYNNMFRDCTKLNYIKAMFTTTPSNTYTSSWVRGVAASGTFIKNSAATWNVTGNNGVPTGWTVEYETPIDYSTQYLTTEALESGTISFNILKNMGTDYITSISYSKDGGNTWITTNNTNNKSANLPITVSVNARDKVLWKGVATQTGFFDDDDFIYTGSFFSSTARFNAFGNIMSLLYNDDFLDKYLLNKEAQFAYLFHDLTSTLTTLIVNASNLILPATTVEYCYYGMFARNSSMVTAPGLPATTLASYCYGSMFRGCTGLTRAPELPATTLISSCYSNMFNGCTNLNYIKALFTTTPSTSYTQNWVNGVAATGTFVKNSAAQWNVTGVNGIPSGWTIQTDS